MTKLFYFLPIISGCIFSLGVQAQIQLSADDIYQEGNFKMTLDVSGGFASGAVGANSTWDYTSLNKNQNLTFEIRPYQSSLNDANMVRISGKDTFQYIQKTTSDIFEIVPLQNFDVIAFEKLRTFSSPMNYQDSFTDSFAQVSYYTGAQLGLFSYDSIKLTYKNSIESLSDAWGEISLPSGNFQSLRIKTTELIKVRITGKKGGMGYEQIPGLDVDETYTDYKWYAKGKGYYLAKLDVENDLFTYMQSNSVSVQNQVLLDMSLCVQNPIQSEMKMHNIGQNTYNISLYDLSGRLIYTSEITPNSIKVYDSAVLPRGVYYLQLLNVESGTITVRKVLKQ
ncbi:MAG: hypothetical protein COA58_14800 [Bacteroidetes bacterium]|nr:MAG: hypothetical protein COA58_14800 [Bacteroidota bacterium]